VSTGDQPRVAALYAAAPEVEARARAAILDDARRTLGAGPGVFLATCHRVEWFGAEPLEVPPSGMQVRTGVHAAQHVIDLALGLRSAVLAEDQILHQLRVAVAEARRQRRLPADVDLLFDHALRAGRTGRSWRPRIATSLADLALERVEAMRGPLAGRTVLVVGTGVMGQRVARLASDRGARSWIASRTRQHAVALAGELAGARDAALDPGPEVLSSSDAVVVALGGAWDIGPATAVVLASRPVVVDLSMPPAIPAATMAVLGPRGVDIDSLGRDALPGADERRYRTRLERLAAATLDGYLQALAERRRSHAARLAARIEDQRREALAAYLRDRPDLDAASREELEQLTRSLSARLFQEPLARLAVDPDGRRGQALDELFGT
jgi:glutamyl-tRNA reductase